MNFVYIDTETSGLTPFSSYNVIDIGAVCGTQTFQRLVKPCHKISKTITSITGITNDELDSNGISCKSACMQFWIWLRQFDNIILVGHNIKLFDAPFLLRMYDKIGLCALFSEYLPIVGIIDTLHIFKRYTHFKSRKLTFLHKHILKCPIQNAHRALSDSIALKNIIESKWFQERHSNILHFKISWKNVLREYRERLIRLVKLQYHTDYCTKCQGYISPYFDHFHS